MRIVIFGLSKSGTTALFYKLKHSLPSETLCLFEPRALPLPAGPSAVARKSFTWRRQHVLAKVLPFKQKEAPDVAAFADFEKQILLVRDPRDRLISKLLYDIYDSGLINQDHKLRIFVELLRQKERDPASVSVMEVLDTFLKLNEEGSTIDQWATGYKWHSIHLPLAFHDRHPTLFTYLYEHMIDQKQQSLESYLDITLQNGAPSIGPEVARVIRTKGYGNWRNWITADDINQLEPLLRPFLTRYYPEADWSLSLKPSIDPEHCTTYVMRLINDRRAVLKLRPFEDPDLN